MNPGSIAGLDNHLASHEIGRMRTPLLARLALFAFIWVGLYGVSYILFDSFGVWARLPGPFVRTLDMLTAAVLVTALIAHLLLSTGRVAER